MGIILALVFLAIVVIVAIYNFNALQVNAAAQGQSLDEHVFGFLNNVFGIINDYWTSFLADPLLFIQSNFVLSIIIGLIIFAIVVEIVRKIKFYLRVREVKHNAKSKKQSQEVDTAKSE